MLKPIGSVYLLRGAGGFYKIGWTANLPTRVSDLQVGSPTELKIVVTGEGTRALEAALHRQFQHRHHRGEWFALSDEDVEEVGRRLAGGTFTIALKSSRHLLAEAPKARKGRPFWRHRKCHGCEIRKACRAMSNGVWLCAQCQRR